MQSDNDNTQVLLHFGIGHCLSHSSISHAMGWSRHGLCRIALPRTSKDCIQVHSPSCNHSNTNKIKERLSKRNTTSFWLKKTNHISRLHRFLQRIQILATCRSSFVFQIFQSGLFFFSRQILFTCQVETMQQEWFHKTRLQLVIDPSE